MIHHESSHRPGEIGYSVIFEFDRESNLEE